MQYLVRLTDRALRDIEAVYEFIEADTSDAAFAWFNELTEFLQECSPNANLSYERTHVEHNDRLVRCIGRLRQEVELQADGSGRVRPSQFAEFSVSISNTYESIGSRGVSQRQGFSRATTLREKSVVQQALHSWIFSEKDQHKVH
jgi:plasmid stabilization system protein ParE